jgi:prevent-host-death family protein
MSKIQTMTASQARNSFTDIISAAQYGNTTTVITRHGIPVAAVVPLPPEDEEAPE